MNKQIKIDNSLCRNCRLCLEMCTGKVFEEKDEIGESGFKIKAAVYPEKCVGCGLCELFCPGAISLGVKDRGQKFTKKNAGLKLSKKEKRGGFKKVKIASPGKYFLSGNQAIVEAAIAAGCGFFAGYPITPASEILEEFVNKSFLLKDLASSSPRRSGLVVVQPEDEIAALGMCLGASWAGKKTMTATSGPGFSLMQESISWGLMTETPTVVVDVQRAGPSTGQPTRPAAMDLREGRWGSHGGVQLIAFYPDSVQECFDLTIAAFNLSEKYRLPVILFSDAYLAHLKEKVEIPKIINVFDRIYTPGASVFGPTSDLKAPSMPKFSDNEYLSITGSTHNPEGLRSTTDPVIQENLIFYFRDKILKNREEIFSAAPVETWYLDDAEIIVVSFGAASRSAKWAIKKARQHGLKIGLIRPKIIFPFPSSLIEESGNKKKLRCFLVPEMNQGQMHYVVREKVSKAVFSYARPNGMMIDPRELLDFILNLSKTAKKV